MSAKPDAQDAPRSARPPPAEQPEPAHSVAAGLPSEAAAQPSAFPEAPSAAPAAEAPLTSVRPSALPGDTTLSSSQPQRVVESRESVAGATGLDGVADPRGEMRGGGPPPSAAVAGYGSREAQMVRAVPTVAQAPPINSWEDTTLTFLASTLTVIIVAIVFRRLLVMSGTDVWALL